jgi:twitching motility protein PilI
VSDFREVVEIVPMPQVTVVPGAQPWLLGVGNLRGNLFPVIDLKYFLEGQFTSLSEGQRVLIVRQAGGDVALTIDELYGQRSFTPEQAVEPGRLAQDRYRYFVDRAYRDDGHDWGVFSLSLLSRTPEFRHAAA